MQHTLPAERRFFVVSGKQNRTKDSDWFHETSNHEKEIEMETKMVRCPGCNGRGGATDSSGGWGSSYLLCDRCNGSGQVDQARIERCGECDGKESSFMTFLRGNVCQNCNGRGFSWVNEDNPVITNNEAYLATIVVGALVFAVLLAVLICKILFG